MITVTARIMSATAYLNEVQGASMWIHLCPITSQNISPVFYVAGVFKLKLIFYTNFKAEISAVR